MSQAKTLPQMLGLSPEPSTLETSTLVLIDMQKEYLPTGAAPLHNVEQALESASVLLKRARQAGTPVVHVVHHGGPGFFDPNGPGSEPCTQVAPIEGEPVVPKQHISAFVDNQAMLDALEKAGRKELIVVGFMTHMCVSTFVRAAAEQYGYKVTVVAECTGTRPLPNPAVGATGQDVAAEQIHLAALAAMNDFFACVVPSVQHIREK